MAKLDLAFQLSANADGVAAGVAQADRELSKVGASAKATSAEFRQAAKITSELRTPSERYAETIQKLDAFMAKGLLTQDVYGRAVAKAEMELNGAEKATGKFRQALEAAGRAATGTANVIRSVGDAAKSVADAGVSVIKFGKDVAWTYLQWKLFNAVRNPAGFKDFAVGALKGALAARTFILAAKALGIGLAIGGGAAGTAAAAVLGLTNPLIGGALLTLNLAKAFINAKDRAFEMATAITEGKVSLEQLNAQLGQIQAQQIDNLAFAMEEATAAGERSEKAFAGLADVFVTPFIGAFAAIQSGTAGFTDGISGVVEGITSILSPIAQVIAPVFTLIGTMVEGVLKFIGVIGEALGLVLKIGGAVVHTFLSPFIVGLTNVVETIRSGMNAAFDFIGERIDWASQKIKDFYAYMSKVPIIGRAFAGGEASGNAMQPAAANGAAAPEQQLDFELQIFSARRENEEAIAKAEKEIADRRLEDEQTIYEARKANEDAIAEANRKAANDQFELNLQMYESQRANEQALRDAETKRQKEQDERNQKIAEKQDEILKVEMDKAKALSGPSNEALKANDLRSSEGMSQFLALATGREDPAIAEYRKQNEKLQQIVAELRALQQQPADILGGAAA
jgi:hypothetical protein